jgi:hypothetical protein
MHPLDPIYQYIRWILSKISLDHCYQCYGGLPKCAKFYDIGSGTGKPVFAAAILVWCMVHGAWGMANGK